MSSQRINYDQLLIAYQSLWKNRSFPVKQYSRTTLEYFIKKELMDENSHPRVRASIYEKFYLGSKRILHSSLSSNEQIQLLTIYKEQMEELKRETKS